MNLVGQTNQDEIKMQILKDQEFQPCIEENISCFSKISFGYTWKLINRGNKLKKENKYLTIDDLSECPKFLHPKVQQNIIQQGVFDKEEKKREQLGDKYTVLDRKLFTDTMKQILKNDPAKAAILIVIGSVLQFSGPIGLKYILESLEEGDENPEKGYIAASVIFVCFILKIFLVQFGMNIVMNYQLTTTTGFMGLIMEKVTRISSSTKKYFETGKIMNFITVDQYMCFIGAILSSQIFAAPIMVFISMVLIVIELSWWGLLTPFFFILSFIIQGYFNKTVFNIRNSTMYWKDKRAKAVYEYFTGIRIIKYYAWEEIVEQEVNKIRKDESFYILKGAYIRTIIESVSNVSPLLISVLVITCYVAAGNDLTPSKSYAILALFNLLTHPIKMMIFSLIVVMQTKASQKRMDHFLNAEERSKDSLVFDSTLNVGTIQIINGEFSWETQESFDHYISNKKIELSMKRVKGEKLKQENDQIDQEIKNMSTKNTTVLKNINFEANKGDFIGVIGTVGSGKTSLIHALIGELSKVKGSVKKNGNIAYISQQSWMQNATLKDNILFGKEYNQKRFKQVIQICELQADLDALPGGDQTEIGERGLNLSGGQKQRLSIARAVYSDADIYIIDDCLSALDAHVGKNIFHNVLNGLLKDKTVIFVTHALQYMQFMSKIAVMQDGELAEFDTFENLQNNKNSVFNKISVQIQKENKEIEEKEEELEQSLQKDQNQKYDEESLYTVRQYDQTYNDEFNIPQESIEQKYQNYVKRNIKPENKDDYQNYLKEVQENLEKKQMQSENKQEQSNPTQIQQEDVKININEEKSLTIENNIPLQKKHSSQQGKQASRQSSTTESQKMVEIKKMKQGAMVEKEERAVGAVSFGVYKNYMQSGGKGTFVILVICLILAQLVRVFNDWWLGEWSNDTFNLSTFEYILIYACSGVGVGLFFVIRGMIFCKFAIECANSYQKRITATLLHTPMAWFDVTPTGRIISRCTKDQDDIDSNLPFSLQNSIVSVLTLLSAVILIVIIIPVFIAFAIITLYMMFKVVSSYLVCVREIKRIEAITRTPVISVIQETINGTYTIRAYDRQNFFMNRYIKAQHSFIVTLVNYNYTQRWVNLHTELLSTIMICATCYLSVLSKDINYMSDSQSMGLAITWAFQITTILSFTLKMVADAESQMNALVRMLQYIENNPKEKEWYYPQPIEGKENWPKQGKIEVNKVTYKYRPDLPEVIKGISFNINPKEKVGIVGRTGSGKSTLTLGLLRILEISKDTNDKLGNIMIDGQDISKVGLHILREKCTIIPQDPVLFTGNIRFNIDPFKKYTNQECIDALKQVQIWDQLANIQNKAQNKQPNVKKNKDTKGHNAIAVNETNLIQETQHNEDETLLETLVDDGGDNFSMGQRQLICMARALIRKPKVLLMDEATASIDEKTDQLIQKMIKHVFKDTTVVTIAHRINTIVQYDKLVMLENGNIVEVDTPLNLMMQNKGLFASLVNEAGEEFRQKMIYLAQNKNIDLDQV